MDFKKIKNLIDARKCQGLFESDILEIRSSFSKISEKINVKDDKGNIIGMQG